MNIFNRPGSHSTYIGRLKSSAKRMGLNSLVCVRTNPISLETEIYFKKGEIEKTTSTVQNCIAHLGFRECYKILVNGLRMPVEAKSDRFVRNNYGENNEYSN